MKNKNIRFITEIGIFAAIGVVLDFIAGLYSEPIWNNGGSISVAMVAIFLMAFRWGLKGGLITGFIIGALQITYGIIQGDIVDPTVQPLLDYILAYSIIGLSGLYAKKIQNTEGVGKYYYMNLAVLLPSAIRLFIHIVSGWIYFRQWIPAGIIEDYPWYYWSVIYNMGYMIPSAILCIIVVRLIAKKYPQFIVIVEE